VFKQGAVAKKLELIGTTGLFYFFKIVLTKYGRALGDVMQKSIV
jgi:hypothetical protein